MAWFIFNQNITLNALSFCTATTCFCSQLFNAYEFHQMLYGEKTDCIFRIKNTYVLLRIRFVFVAKLEKKNLKIKIIAAVWANTIFLLFYFIL